MKLTYLYLTVAIVAEVMATSFLKSSDGFTKWWPSVITVLGYAISFACLSLTLRVMPIGVAYAIWAGAGVVLIATVGWLWHGQALDAKRRSASPRPRCVCRSVPSQPSAPTWMHSRHLLPTKNNACQQMPGFLPCKRRSWSYPLAFPKCPLASRPQQRTSKTASSTSTSF